jgi:hypothetical protein
VSDELITHYELGLKVRGVALWVKSLQGQAPVVVDAAFDTLLRAADALEAHDGALIEAYADGRKDEHEAHMESQAPNSQSAGALQQ